MMAKKKILVVEDNMLNREMLKNILFPEYEILEAENGQEALSILQAQEGDISLILLDIVRNTTSSAPTLKISSWLTTSSALKPETVC